MVVAGAVDLRTAITHERLIGEASAGHRNICAPAARAASDLLPAAKGLGVEDRIATPGVAGAVVAGDLRLQRFVLVGMLAAAAAERQMYIVNANLPGLTWEVNYWAMMEDSFTNYHSEGHDDSMITNVCQFIVDEQKN
jgi:hypothetical protein